MKRYIKSAATILWPWKIYAEFEDGYEQEFGGFDEYDAMSKMIEVHDSGKHGDVTFYTGVTDEYYEAGERIYD